MASILKVDQIQLPDGSAPTASDLGVDVSGNVVQTQYAEGSTQAATSASGLFLKGTEVLFTPKYQTSKLIIHARIPYNLYDTASENFGWLSPAITVNGSKIDPNPSHNYEYGINFGTSSWADFRGVATVQSVYTHNTTNQIEIAIQAAKYAGGHTLTINEGGWYKSTIIVQEIAQ